VASIASLEGGKKLMIREAPMWVRTHEAIDAVPGSDGPYRSRRRLCRGRQLAAILIAAALVVLVAAPIALGAGRVYWANRSGNKISFASLDGSGGGDLVTTGATVSGPFGIAIDPAAGRIYWPNFDANKISYANLNGTGGGDLSTGSATVSGPVGIAIDPAAGRIYWANHGANKISFAKLDGTGGGDLATGSATVSVPFGLAIDPAAGRIYWASEVANKISFAKLDGTGGADLNTTGATVSAPTGVAVDPAAGRIYWVNFGANKISYANLDGTGGADLNTTGVTVNGPEGAALDPAAGRIYWANISANTISYANLDGTGGADLATSGATTDFPVFPALLESPVGTGVPAVGGGASVGSTLSCSQGSWAPDLLSEFLYRAPASFAFQWGRAGADISGANQSSITASTPGEYRCTVTATNFAGSTAQRSSPFTVSAPPAPPIPKAPPPNTKITKTKINSAKRMATFKFKATGGSTGFQCALFKKHKKPKFKKCSSPKTYKQLKPGTYIFGVRAIGAGGPDPTPAKKKFKIR
jgi:DNA-binding beta-propeller fold protein YncE